MTEVENCRILNQQQQLTYMLIRGQLYRFLNQQYQAFKWLNKAHDLMLKEKITNFKLADAQCYLGETYVNTYGI